MFTLIYLQIKQAPPLFSTFFLVQFNFQLIFQFQFQFSQGNKLFLSRQVSHMLITQPLTPGVRTGGKLLTPPVTPFPRIGKLNTHAAAGNNKRLDQIETCSFLLILKNYLTYIDSMKDWSSSYKLYYCVNFLLLDFFLQNKNN